MTSIRIYARIFLATALLLAIFEFATLFHYTDSARPFRPPGPATNKTSLRILTIGDSVSENYPDQLEAELIRLGRGADVFTIAKPGMSASSAKKIVEKVTEEHGAPDLILMMLGLQANRRGYRENWQPFSVFLMKNFAKRSARKLQLTLDKTKTWIFRWRKPGPECQSADQLAKLAALQLDLTIAHPQKFAPSDLAAFQNLEPALFRCINSIGSYASLALLRKAQQFNPSAKFFLKMAKSHSFIDDPALTLAISYFSFLNGDTRGAKNLLDSHEPKLHSPAIDALALRITSRLGAPPAPLPTPAYPSEIQRRFEAAWAESAVATGGHRMALPVLEKLVDWRPNFRPYLETLGTAYNGLEWAERTLPVAGKLLHLDPDNTYWLDMLYSASTVASLEQGEATLKQLKAAGALNPAIDYYLTLLRIEREKDFSHGDGLIKSFPNPHTKTDLARLAHRMASPKLAIEIFRGSLNAQSGGLPKTECEDYRELAASLDEKKIPWIALQYPHLPAAELHQCLGNKNKIFDSRNALFPAHSETEPEKYFKDDFMHLNQIGTDAFAKNLAKWLDEEFRHGSAGK